MEQLQTTIEEAFDRRADMTPRNVDANLKESITQVLEMLDSGKLRVAEKIDGEWVVHQWLKKAVLLFFRCYNNDVIEGAESKFYDKVPLKFTDYTTERFAKEGMRVVPPAAVRTGTFIGKNVVLMPSYVNIGAFVDEGTMVDTWATVGSCAQIGKNVHLSGGVGIGGVLEPLQANPTIIEDNCFIGSRSIIVEGVHIGQEAVLGANVVITQTTKIIDVSGEVPIELKGKVPPRSVVIPGTTTKKFPAGEFQIPCALIIGTRKETTDKKTSLNDALREYNVSV